MAINFLMISIEKAATLYSQCFFFWWIMYAEKSAAENLWFTNTVKAFVKDSVGGTC